ncbi:MAG: 5-formyltetrahydrofolate cyclo-ligase [Prochlorococcaceae cyanobacterium ETNP1_MAG_9]|nr:5-formyltetrahydrofolate cyclo-ligase [Prochlorococcaceae cyanobacterium ETNP1_MAG_9]
MNNANTKSMHRVNYKSIRNKVITDAEKLIIKNVNKKIQNLLKNNELKGYLGIYWPLNNEVDLRGLKENYNIPIALPAITKEGLLTYRPWTESPLENDFHGIPAPLNEPILEAKELSLLLVPAIAIDLKGYRLGYGGGFFDRLRSTKNWSSVPALVVLPKACIVRKPLPRDSWDIPFNGWINEDGEFQPNNEANI